MPSQMEALVRKYDVKATFKSLGRKVPGGGMGDKLMNAYKVTLKHAGKSFTTDFYTGLGWDRKPSAADVLGSLVLDATCDVSTFEDFCSEFGYDTDSRKAEATYKAIKATAPKIKHLLAPHFAEFAKAEH